MGFRNRLFSFIDGERGNNKHESIFEYFLAGLILLNVVCIFLESYPEINREYKDWFHALEIFSIVVFSIEYLLRIWLADLQYANSGKIKSRFNYVFSFLGLIDLLSILPFYLPFFIRIDLRIVRILRLFRLLRILKLNRHSRAMRVIGKVFSKTKHDIMVTIFMVFILLILASTLMYTIENNAQPEAFNNMGEALWWAVATLTTVGYGDIYPITGLGKFLSGVIALLGIGIVALPTGIISSAYIEEVQNSKQTCECPKCGEIIKK